MEVQAEKEAQGKEKRQGGEGRLGSRSAGGSPDHQPLGQPGGRCHGNASQSRHQFSAQGSGPADLPHLLDLLGLTTTPKDRANAKPESPGLLKSAGLSTASRTGVYSEQGAYGLTSTPSQIPSQPPNNQWISAKRRIKARSIFRPDSLVIVTLTSCQLTLTSAAFKCQGVDPL